jgi:TonB family protein
MPDHSLKTQSDLSALAGSAERRQRNRMMMAVLLLLIAVGVVVFKDRQDASSTAARSAAQGGSTGQMQTSGGDDAAGLRSAPQEIVRAPSPAPSEGPAETVMPTAPKPSAPHHAANSLTHEKRSATSAAPVESGLQANGPAVTATRAVLPPLRVEVVAGDRPKSVKPGNPSLKVDMQPGSPARPAADGTSSAPESAMSETGPLTDAAERVQVSEEASQVVTHRVRPEYPLLARQMKVQGSVVLDAMIGKDGGIQDLRVVEGPTILAEAARQAVRQWRFKPYVQDGQAVETQAHITVNFMISTN